RPPSAQAAIIQPALPDIAATSDGALTMPAPTTMPTMIAIASRRPSPACGPDAAGRGRGGVRARWSRLRGALLIWEVAGQARWRTNGAGSGHGRTAHTPAVAVAGSGIAHPGGGERLLAAVAADHRAGHLAVMAGGAVEAMQRTLAV